MSMPCSPEHSSQASIGGAAGKYNVVHARDGAQLSRRASLLSLVSAGTLLPQGLGAGRSAHGGPWSPVSPLPLLTGPGLRKAHPSHPQNSRTALTCSFLHGPCLLMAHAVVTVPTAPSGSPARSRSHKDRIANR